MCDQPSRCTTKQPFRAHRIAAQRVRAADGELRERLPQTCCGGIAGGLPGILEHLMGVEGPAGIEQLLRVMQRLLRRASNPLRLPGNASRAMRERAAKAVARSGAAGAPRCVTVAIHHSSVPRGPRRPLATALQRWALMNTSRCGRSIHLSASSSELRRAISTAIACDGYGPFAGSARRRSGTWRRLEVWERATGSRSRRGVPSEGHRGDGPGARICRDDAGEPARTAGSDQRRRRCDLHASGFVPTESGVALDRFDRACRDRNTVDSWATSLGGSGHRHWVMAGDGTDDRTASVRPRRLGIADGTLAEYVAIEARNLAPLPGATSRSPPRRESADLRPHRVAGPVRPHGRLSRGAEASLPTAPPALLGLDGDATRYVRSGGSRHRHRTCGRPGKRRWTSARTSSSTSTTNVGGTSGRDLVFDVIGGDVQQRSAALIRAGGDTASVVGPSEARLTDGLRSTSSSRPIVADWAQIVQRVRDGRCTHPGPVVRRPRWAARPPDPLRRLAARRPARPHGGLARRVHRGRRRPRRGAPDALHRRPDRGHPGQGVCPARGVEPAGTRRRPGGRARPGEPAAGRHRGARDHHPRLGCGACGHPAPIRRTWPPHCCPSPTCW